MISKNKDIILKSKIFFGNNVFRKRQENGISQFELSKLSGLSVPTLWRIENSTANPSLGVMMSIAIALNVKLNDLINF